MPGVFLQQEYSGISLNKCFYPQVRGQLANVKWLLRKVIRTLEPSYQVSIYLPLGGVPDEYEFCLSGP